MAYEGMFEFIDSVSENASRAKEKNPSSFVTYLEILILFHNQALSAAKFRSQRDYCKKKIFELSPSFFKGYFKRNSP